jgi:preprotein translocase subunit SecE
VVGLFFYLVRHEPAMLFLTEVVGELKKVVWPTRKETTLSTVVVIVLVFVTAVLLWVFDLVWAGLVRLIVS